VDRSVRVVKKVIDVVGASLGLALTLPWFPVIAAAISLDSPGPIFIRQPRAGEFKSTESMPPGSAARAPFRSFDMIKFRSMRREAEKDTGPVLASENDPRVTRVGRFLRRTHLDELPQFWNVLRGEMSVVGPRPERPELAAQLAMAIPYFEERMRDVKPGITGFAQVSLGYAGKPGRDSVLAKFETELTNPFKVEGTEDAVADHMRIKLLYDLAYSAATEDLRHFLPLELSILIKTPVVMLRAIAT
jgi:lipopolysaccharide/colanic/teichoic acid biosynthesis glycosyltransferase